MSKFGIAAFASAAVVLLATAMSAQDQQNSLRPGEEAVPANPGDGPGQADQDQGFYRASEILGSSVRGEGGKDLGQIQDLLIDRQSQRISHFILAEDGAQPVRTDRTGRQPAREVDAHASVRVVPWSVAKTQFSAQERIVTVPLAQQRFQQAPTYTWQEIQAGPRAGWYGEVNKFYGVQGRPGNVEVERDGDVEIEGARPRRPGRNND